MKGTISPSGEVTITFNLQTERLEAPPVDWGDTKEPRQWLPCDKCGELQSVANNVVSVLCDSCFATHEDEDRPDPSTLGGSVLTGREH